MIDKFELTIRGALDREVFQGAKVVAGNNRLDKQVKWTHILETNDFESLINGGELILTTGAGLQFDSPNGLMNMKKLIQRNAAGICIEFGTHINQVFPEVLKLADDHGFPVIVFEEVVKFVDITQDLHTLLINQQYQMLSELNILSVKFIEQSLLPNGILKILQLLHSYFKREALFMTEDAKPYYYPQEAKQTNEILQNMIIDIEGRKELQKFLSVNNETFALFPVKSPGQVWGYLCLQAKDSLSDDFFFSVMDRAALAISQIQLRNKTIEERKQNIEDQLVWNLLQGKNCESEDVQAILPAPAKNLYYRVFLIQTNMHDRRLGEEDWEELKLQRTMLIRSLFKRQGFFPAISVKKNEIAVVCFFISKDELIKQTDRFTQIAQLIRELKESNVFTGSNCDLGISKVYQELSCLAKSYQEARDVLVLKEVFVSQTYFYENIGVYRLLLTLRANNQLESYVTDYLGFLLEYDKTTESDLFTTLEIYLECGGSKKEAADRLFIVRQTLYYRLEKIKQLLGSGFMEPTNRLAIETAIKAHRLLQIT